METIGFFEWIGCGFSIGSIQVDHLIRIESLQKNPGPKDGVPYKIYGSCIQGGAPAR